MTTGSVCMVYGTYIYGGVSYLCNQDGLHQFFNENTGATFNRLVCTGVNGTTDMYKFLSGVSSMHVHGTDDNSNAFASISLAGRYRKWRQQCGYIVDHMVWLLPQSGLGFSARRKSVKTLGPLNGWDDGHVVLEVLIGGNWCMFDITNGCYFTQGGVHLDTAGFIAQIAGGGAFPTKVVMDKGDKFNSQSVGSIDLSIVGERMHADDTQREAWYRRVFQVIV